MAGGPPPVKRGGFTLATPAGVAASLAGKLRGPVDRVRDLHTRLGGRQYRVTIVRTRWSGGRRGLGSEEVLSEVDVLPTPLVVDLSSLSEVVTPVGVNEQGLLQVQQISPRFTEEVLLGVDPFGTEPGPDENVYWEVQFLRGDGLPADRRRFLLQSAPTYHAYRVQWQVTLVQANEDRARDGEPRG